MMLKLTSRSPVFGSDQEAANVLYGEYVQGKAALASFLWTTAQTLSKDALE